MPELAITPDPADVRRCLGYGRRGAPSAAVAARLERLWDEATGLLRPRGAWRVVEGAAAAGAGMPRPARTVAVALATVGAELEREVRRRAQAGLTLDAMILDAVGSAAAEAAADAINEQLCGEAQRLSLHAAARVSPGYGRWPLASQAALLALLPADALGVSLTESLMMVPRKSVSFALNLLRAPPRRRAGGDRCRRCGCRECPYAGRQS